MISRDRAIAIARERVEYEGVMSLEGRDTVAEKKGDEVHVYFPLTTHDLRAGEPHVWVDLRSGEVTNITYTR